MASIAYEGKKGERVRLVFRDDTGKQQSLRLGRCGKAGARSALAGFERVIEAKRLGTTMHPDGVAWLAGLDNRVYARVVALGLCQPRQPEEVVTLSKLVERFNATASIKPSTVAAYKQTTDSLLAHLKGATPLASITPAQADDWRKAIADSGLAPATVAKRVRVARTVFRRAVRWRMIPASPFAELRAGSQANPDRLVYVPRETIAAVLAACPDAEWRAIVALSRYAGLRCPSETMLLRWGDVNWERGTMNVRSPKTAGHEGHGARRVPIAPELAEILLALFDRAEPGVEAVIPRLRDPKMNLRTSFTKIVEKAGHKPWPRLFHNLRASCGTDWADRVPVHSVAAWLGHSPTISAKHYLQSRDSHLDLVTGRGAATNPATEKATDTRQGAPTQNQRNAETPTNQANFVACGRACDRVEKEEMGATGLEPVTSAM
ncbi:MAG: site-specific integrase [Phycisphaerales bacterium]|nr:site-specific integrase [Phycisphaerales bacterium]